MGKIELKRVGVRPRYLNYLFSLYFSRVFIFTLAYAKVEAKNNTSRFGYLWLILTPLIDAAVYGTVFGMLQGPNRPEHFIQFLIIGVFLFRVFTDCVSAGARSIINSQALVQSLSFPRAVLPLAVALEQFINFIPVLIVMLLVNFVLEGGATLNWLWLIPVLILYGMFCIGVVLICARVAIHFRDITQIIPFANRFMRYFSGVFYSPVVFVGSLPIVMALFTLNPVYAFMELARWALISGYNISNEIVISGIVWAGITFIFGSIYFWAAEERYGRVD